MKENKIVKNPDLSTIHALIPVVGLIIMLAFNVFVFGDNAISGSNQFILLMGAVLAVVVGYFNGVSYEQIIDEIAESISSTSEAIIILLLVGGLAGSWLLSGIIPSMIYYGLLVLHPSIFLPACIVITIIISLATGSSWSTTATVGIALIGIGQVMDISVGMVAGAVISGAYFGDKMSPLSDTTNLAAAMAGSDLFDHIRYMSLTTIPTISITFIIFIILSIFNSGNGSTNIDPMLAAIESKFFISPILFLVPAFLIFLVIRKVKPIYALFISILLGGAFAIIFQPSVVQSLADVQASTFIGAYKGVVMAITEGCSLGGENELIADLFSSSGMAGMLGTIFLVIAAMCFGGAMDAIGALDRLSSAMLDLANSTFGLFASTVASCLTVNVTASDQYLAIVVPGKMFKKAYQQKGLAPENLSRTLEDGGTVTSVLVPWNTCGAYQSGVLGVSVADYFIYAIFNYLSPFMTLLYAALKIRIKMMIK